MYNYGRSYAISHQSVLAFAFLVWVDQSIQVATKLNYSPTIGCAWMDTVNVVSIALSLMTY